MKKPLVLVLACLATIVVVAAIVFAVVSFSGAPSPTAFPQSQGPDSPPPASATSTPTRTPLATTRPPSTAAPATRAATGAPDAGASAPVFTSSSIQTTVTCPVPEEGPDGGTADSPTVALRWSSTGATTAFVGVATTDAQSEPYAEVATSGTDSIPFPCPEAGQQYTITLVGPGGVTSTTTTVGNTGYRG